MEVSKESLPSANFEALAMPLFPHFFAITILQALTGVADSVFAPALAAITLGLVGTKFFARRVGRNQSFNHAGNATAGVITGGLAYYFGPTVVFWVLAAMAVLSVVATLRIPGDAIDHEWPAAWTTDSARPTRSRPG